jgi:2-methylisocitrate lyase-like PEP mutase family enzyme
VFFGAGIPAADGLAEARERAAAYAEAGASGLFLPGLTDLDSIADLCRGIDLPLNVMAMPGLPDARALADAGVARISHGPAAYLHAMEAVLTAARRLFAGTSE